MMDLRWAVELQGIEAGAVTDVVARVDVVQWGSSAEAADEVHGVAGAANEIHPTVAPDVSHWRCSQPRAW